MFTSCHNTRIINASIQGSDHGILLYLENTYNTRIIIVIYLLSIIRICQYFYKIIQVCHIRDGKCLKAYLVIKHIHITYTCIPDYYCCIFILLNWYLVNTFIKSWHPEWWTNFWGRPLAMRHISMSKNCVYNFLGFIQPSRLTSNSQIISIQRQFGLPPNLTTFIITVSSYFTFGLPKGLLHIRFCPIVVLSSEFRFLIACPTHCSLSILIVLKMFFFVIHFWLFVFFLLLHSSVILSFIGPTIFRNIFLFSFFIMKKLYRLTKTKKF